MFFLCVDGVYIKDGKILLVKRGIEPFKGRWHLVGGHVEDNETFREALIREFKEETNLDIEVGKILDGRIESSFDRTKIVVVFEVTTARGEIKLNYENVAFDWFKEVPSNSVYDYSKYLTKKNNRELCGQSTR